MMPADVGGDIECWQWAKALRTPVPQIVCERRARGTNRVALPIPSGIEMPARQQASGFTNEHIMQ
jgi:hypothetical protein